MNLCWIAFSGFIIKQVTVKYHITSSKEATGIIFWILLVARWGLRRRCVGRPSFSATAQTVSRFMSRPASLEPLRKNTQIAELGTDVVEVAPLPNYAVLRDVATDFTDFFSHHNRAKPFLIRKDPDDLKPVERENLVASSEVIPVAGQLQLKLALANNTAKPLENVLVKFLVEGQVRLVRMKPAYAGADWNGEITIPSIPASSSRRVLFYFSPSSCEPVGLDILVQYQDAAGKFIDENLSEKVDLAPPVFVKKQVITKEHFHDIITNHLKIKGIKSYGIPAGLAPTDAYLIIKEILITNEFEFVGEKFLEDKNQFLGWYYAGFKTGEKESDFIVIGQVLNNKMEFFAMASDGMQLLSGLTMLAKTLRESLVERGTIKDELELVELVCPSCGGVLDVFPTSGQLHTCKFCGAKLQF